MPRKEQAPTRTSFDDDWTEENQARCPGFKHIEYEIAGEPYTCLVRCDPFPIHPHREQVKIEGRDRTRIPLYRFIETLATEDEARRNIAQRQKRAGRRGAGYQKGAKGMEKAFKKAGEGQSMPERGTVLKPTFSQSDIVPF